MELQHIQLNNMQGVIDSLMAHEGHLSFSSLKAFADSPSTFAEYKLAKREPSDAMLFGAMLHCLVLEPKDFEKRYLCLDDQDICNQIGGAKPRATKAYKEWKAVTVAEAGDREIVDTNEYLAAKVIASNVLHNRASAKILDLCWEHEKPIEWEFQNFMFKGFIDGKGEKAIMDLKTCPDAEQDKFQRDIINNRYYLQAAMYLYAVGENIPYYIIAVDKKSGVSVHKLHDKLIEHGMNEYNTLVGKFNECILKDHFDRSYDFWSDRMDGTFICEKPGWLY
jgi:hypothetical protein